ncbi:DUF4227 family protein [Gracilibacillus marinus]|jgi:hypothetical protein|uniref:DUF4227 family protein n=1 Tax=Gracilibacillus marinus TaxID=630535 RepID=A0ABV8VUP1_9BACI
MATFFKMFYEMLKIFVLFIVCTILFYYVIKTLHNEYQYLNRYDEPQGSAIKVMNHEDELLNRLNIFFRLGE